MKNSYLYKHGLPFSEILGVNLDDLLTRISSRKASLLIIDGGMGEGKTTLGVEAMQYVMHRLDDSYRLVEVPKEFYDDWRVDLENQLAMGGEEFQEKLFICKERKLVVAAYDEAGDFNKRGAITSFNQNLMRIFQTFRAYKILIILLLPSFNSLDNELFSLGVPRLLLHCHDRNEREGNIMGFGLNEMFYLKHYMKKEVNPLRAYKKVTPNFRAHFKDLPSHIAQKLDEISTDAKSATLSQNILKQKGLMNFNEIGKEVGRSAYWVRRSIKELNIEPVQVFKKVNYYEGSVVGALSALKGGKANEIF